MSGVLFFSYSRDINALEGLRLLFTKSKILGNMPEKATVAIKLHMGDLGDIRYIRPVFAWQVASLVKEYGGKPFLFDTVSANPGNKKLTKNHTNTAAINGFTRDTIGAPVVITDNDGKFVNVPINNRVDNPSISNAEIPEKLVKSDVMIVLSHVKGYTFTGFGGAIKNLGTGCVSTRTKQAQNLVNSPKLKDTAECDGCNLCIVECPAGALAIVNNKVQKAEAKCTGCCTCYFTCPNEYWYLPKGTRDKLQVNIAHAAGAVLSAYKGQVIYVNFIQDVIPYCDYIAMSSPPVVQDAGIMLSLDPISIDKASLDIIDMSPVIEPKATPKPPDILGKIHNTDSTIQLRTAEKLDIGEMNYSIVSV
jgi:uncharacterized Fe-S center protein